MLKFLRFEVHACVALSKPCWVDLQFCITVSQKWGCKYNFFSQCRKDWEMNDKVVKQCQRFCCKSLSFFCIWVSKSLCVELHFQITRSKLLMSDLQVWLTMSKKLRGELQIWLTVSKNLRLNGEKESQFCLTVW